MPAIPARRNEENKTMNFENDIPLSVAINAFSGTSFSPDRRGGQYVADYAKTLAGDLEELSIQAEAGGTAHLLQAEFDRYRDGYRKRYLAYLHSHSRIVSTMIAGGSNFPVRRMQKRNNVCDKRAQELIEFRARAIKAIKATLRPDLQPIRASDYDACERLRHEIASLEDQQAYMTKINKAHKQFLRDAGRLECSDLTDSDRALIRNYKPAYSWEPHPFAPFQLTNNNANIRRLRARLEQISAAKAAPVVAQESTNGVRMEDDPPANRVRLFFPGKPDASVRSTLKGNGFRWAPSIGAWQGYRNTRTLSTAQQLVSV